jgi:short-chain fatty acids transporter
MRTIARFFTYIAERYLPDAFIFLFFLTLLVFILGMLQGSGPREVLDYWGGGFFDILEFTMQSTLMLVTGFALANTPPVHRALRAFARLPRNEVQILILTVLVMMVFSWISWGFGLIAGAIVAREMGIVHRGRIHYPLVVAGTYAGFLVWHAGYGGAIPQLIATPGHFLEEQMGVIPVIETIFAPVTLIIVLALAIIIPITVVLMRPRSDEERVDLPEEVLEEEEELTGERTASEASGHTETPASSGVQGSGKLTPEGTGDATRTQPWSIRVEQSRYITLVLGMLGLLYLISYFAGGGALNINIVILTFLVPGLLLIPNTREYLTQITGGASAAYGIIIQFPFYGGIMGVMVGSGLAATIANFFVTISSADTLPFWAFISGGLINMFVPSGGGQWAVQGPIMIDAAEGLNADIAKTAMGVAWGDAWTNMVQPFWTLPLLAIAGLGIRAIMGYTAVVLIVSGVVIGTGLLIL